MPRKDLFHDVVKAALEADGWVITSDPFPLKFGEENLFIDLGADAPLAAEKEGRKIAVEIKSFTGRSPMTDLERALGQFTLYRFLLTRQDPERILYLAIDAETYQASTRQMLAILQRHCNYEFLPSTRPRSESQHGWHRNCGQ